MIFKFWELIVEFFLFFPRTPLIFVYMPLINIFGKFWPFARHWPIEARQGGKVFAWPEGIIQFTVQCGALYLHFSGVYIVTSSECYCCSAVQCSAVQCSAVQCSAVQFNAVQSNLECKADSLQSAMCLSSFPLLVSCKSARLYSTILCYLYYTILYYTLLYILHYTIRYSTILCYIYYTIL